jgi:hypothetical protein
MVDSSTALIDSFVKEEKMIELSEKFVREFQQIFFEE